MEAFVYCWTDHKTNMLYVGSHKGSSGDGYICSSKYMLEQYNIRPHDFTRKIIAEGTFSDIRKLEEVILKSVNAAKSEEYYNQSNSNGEFTLKFHTEKSKKAIGEANKGNVRKDLSERNKLGLTPETRKKISQNHHDVSNEKNPMFCKKHSEESRLKMKLNSLGKGTNPKSEETKRKMAEARKLYWDRKKGIIE
jgi:hypothetical protein